MTGVIHMEQMQRMTSFSVQEKTSKTFGETLKPNFSKNKNPE